MTASTRCLAKLAKAVSTSLSLLVFTTSSFRPSASAAACISRVSASALGFVGSTRNPTTVPIGISSRRSSSRFAPRVVTRKLTPVTLRSGRLRLVTKPSCTASPPVMNTMGFVVSRPSPPPSMGCSTTITADLPTNQVGCQHRQPVVFILRPAIFDRDVPALDKARSHRDPEGMRPQNGCTAPVTRYSEIRRPGAPPAAGRAPRAATLRCRAGSMASRRFIRSPHRRGRARWVARRGRAALAVFN